VEELVLLGQLPAACLASKARALAPGEEGDWQVLLRVAARSGGGRCLTDADGDALAAWATGRAGWDGPRAEWLAASGDPDAALALLGPAGNDAARLRVVLARDDGDAARTAAEGAVIEDPRDVLACRILGLAALDAGDVSWAIEQAGCGGIGARAPELVRIEAEALDRAGELAAAEEAYTRAGATVHRAALLYQENPTPERLAEATRLLAPGPEGRPPPAALHAVWLALLTGGTPSVEGLDGSVPGTVARALVTRAPADIARLAGVPGAPAAIVRARFAAERGDRAAMEVALREALDLAPAAEPVHRARIALRLRAGGDVAGALADWAAQDSDHVALVGTRGARDLPWAVVVPERWDDLAHAHPDPRMRPEAPRGADAVGARWRAARALPDAAARADALDALAEAAPGLDALAGERYRLGPPPPGNPPRAP
jgi:hypothetical protein